jgi:DNA-binding LytR/AlgR family response regulator
MAGKAPTRSMHGALQIASAESTRLRAAFAAMPSPADRPQYLQRIPVRNGNNLVLVPTSSVTTVVAEGPNLIIRTRNGETHSFNYRLKDLAAHLDPANFVRLGRGALANLNTISRIVVGPGGTNRVVFDDGYELTMSRIQSRRLRNVVLALLST